MDWKSTVDIDERERFPPGQMSFRGAGCGEGMLL